MDTNTVWNSGSKEREVPGDSCAEGSGPGWTWSMNSGWDHAWKKPKRNRQIALNCLERDLNSSMCV